VLVLLLVRSRGGEQLLGASGTRSLAAAAPEEEGNESGLLSVLFFHTLLTMITAAMTPMTIPAMAPPEMLLDLAPVFELLETVPDEVGDVDLDSELVAVLESVGDKEEEVAEQSTLLQHALVLVAQYSQARAVLVPKPQVPGSF
jgi:hypothetical protein